MPRAHGTRPRVLPGSRASRSRLFADTWMTVVTIVLIAPILLVVVTSLKDSSDVIARPLGLPSRWQWHNFVDAWQQGHFSTYFLNSIIVVVPSVLGVVALSLLGAYAFARYRFPAKQALFALFLIGLTIPLDILVVPLYYEMRDFHLLDTLWALILPQVAIGLPFGLLLLRSFIQDIPEEIFQAGQLDGCSSFRMLVHIVVPLAWPALITLVVFNFMWTWNQFLLPTVMIQTDEVRTLPVGLNYFQGRFATDIPLLMAGATIAFLPVVAIYLVFQRQFIKGITAGAVK